MTTQSDEFVEAPVLEGYEPEHWSTWKWAAESSIASTTFELFRAPCGVIGQGFTRPLNGAEASRTVPPFYERIDLLGIEVRCSPMDMHWFGYLGRWWWESGAGILSETAFPPLVYPDSANRLLRLYFPKHEIPSWSTGIRVLRSRFPSREAAPLTEDAYLRATLWRQSDAAE